jgi:flagellar P-ring protein precursor FlgI
MAAPSPPPPPVFRSIVNKGPNKQLAILDGRVSLQQLVSGLNSLGVAPHDMISILQSIKADGALQADLEVQ